MERNGRWLNWAALIVGGLALILALGGRSSQSTVHIQVPGGAAAVAPDAGVAQRGNGPGFGADDSRAAEAAGPRAYGRDAGPMGNHRPHFGPFGFLGGILKFFGFLLIIGLVMRFVFGRRGWGGPPWRRGAGGPPWQQGQAGAPTEAPRPESTEQKGDNDETPPSTGETVRL